MPIVSHRNISDDDIHIPFLTSTGSPEGSKDGLINHFCLDVSSDDLYRKVTNSGGNTGWEMFSLQNDTSYELETLKFVQLNEAPTASLGTMYFDGENLYLNTI